MRLAALLCLSRALLAAETTQPDILHRPLGCIAPGQYPVIQAAMRPGLDVRTAKVYFRSDKYPKFYYVEMKPQPEGFESVLPRPGPETEHIVYYIEAVDVSFSNSVGEEHIVAVQEDCSQTSEQERPPVTATDIVVGATEPDAPAFPPGFHTLGIVGTITSAGVSSAIGGGSGVGTTIAVGAAAAGAGGTVVVVTRSEETEPTEPPAAPEGPPPAEPGPPPAPPPTEPETPEPPAPPSEPEEPTEPEDPEPPSPPPASAVQACFQASFPGSSCNLKLNGRCSSGPIETYEWRIEAGAVLGGVTTHTGSTVNRNFPLCSGETVLVALTVRSAGASDTTSRSVTLPVSLDPLIAVPLRTSFVSLLEPKDGAQGRVLLNQGRVDRVEGKTPARHDFEARRGGNRVEAVLLSALSGEGRWTFDLSGARHFEPGSLRVERGNVLAIDAGRIVFRLSGAPGERIAFRFRLSP